MGFIILFSLLLFESFHKEETQKTFYIRNSRDGE